MRKINIKDIPEESWTSPKGKFGGASQEISVALGRKPESTDLNERHPFDIEICRIPPGQSLCPYHSHSAQWEFYHVISGNGIVRHIDGTTPIVAGDAFIFEPDQPHQLTNDGSQDIVLYIERITRSASHAIILTARNGSCAHPNPDIRAPRTRKEEPTRWQGSLARLHFSC